MWNINSWNESGYIQDAQLVNKSSRLPLSEEHISTGAPIQASASLLLDTLINKAVQTLKLKLKVSIETYPFPKGQSAIFQQIQSGQSGTQTHSLLISLFSAPVL